jgi:hypothetical protein
VARPIPCDAPVTSATLFFKLNMDWFVLHRFQRLRKKSFILSFRAKRGISLRSKSNKREILRRNARLGMTTVGLFPQPVQPVSRLKWAKSKPHSPALARLCYFTLPSLRFALAPTSPALNGAIFHPRR